MCSGLTARGADLADASRDRRELSSPQARPQAEPAVLRRTEQGPCPRAAGFADSERAPSTRASLEPKPTRQ